jgi:type II secretory pathway predicted ATPase ExeA
MSRDPFAELETPYVSLPSHDEAVARLAFGVETAQRKVVVVGPAGAGKTAVLRKVLAEIVSPRRRIAAVSCPGDSTLLCTMLAERLGQRVGREPSRVEAWRAIGRALRLASLQGFQVVIAIDDCEEAADEPARNTVDLLVHLATTGNAGLTVLQGIRAELSAESVGVGSWDLAIGLERLTRSQTESYISAKLKWAGGTDRTFTPRAITRLHALTLGVPRRIEQLALLCLVAGAVRGMEVIQPDLVDGVAREQRALSVGTSD